ncbi:MAG: hypothetical protein ACI9CA_000033 [Natronomonas sp.]|jgi:hypothetical protein
MAIAPLTPYAKEVRSTMKQANLTDFGTVTPRAVNHSDAVSAVRVLPRAPEGGDAVVTAATGPRPVRQATTAATRKAPRTVTGEAEAAVAPVNPAPEPRDVNTRTEAAVRPVGYDGPNPETGGVWTHPSLAEGRSQAGYTAN